MNYIADDVFLERADLKGREAMLEAITNKHGASFRASFGRSILSREITGVIIGEGRTNILICAAHHALEDITANLAFMLADYLLELRVNGCVKGVDCKLLLSKYRFIILPCVNPDGIEMRYHGCDNSPLEQRQLRMSGGDFSAWQANARGVDLNHNYDYRFLEYKEIESKEGICPGASLYSGEYPESEPETRSVANLIRTVFPSVVVSLHSQGEEIYSFPDNAAMMRRAERLSALTGYKCAVPTGTASYGGLCDYSGSLGIPSFTFEVGKGKNPLPLSYAPTIFERIGDALVILPSLL